MNTAKRVTRKASRSPGTALELGELSHACEAALNPISVRFLELGFGVNLFLQVAKRAYVNAAISAIRRAGERPTHSRIAAITGLQRKEVKALIDGLSEESQSSTRLPPTMRVLIGWQSDTEFLASNRKPRALPIEGEGSLRKLVEKYAGDVTHVAILRELERVSRVVKRADGLVELLQPGPDLTSKLQSIETFSACIADYAVAMTGKGEPVDGGVYAGHRVAKPTDARVGAALARTFSKRAEEFLDGFERWVSRAGKESAISTREATSTFAIGVYLVERPVAKQLDRRQRPPTSRPSKRA
ncbi:MAG: DUF6502 family protein [Steroidobacteraceae bacterium]